MYTPYVLAGKSGAVLTLDQNLEQSSIYVQIGSLSHKVSHRGDFPWFPNCSLVKHYLKYVFKI